MHPNKKASNESKTTTNTENKTDKKEESNYKETTSKNEIEKEKDITNKTNRVQIEETKDTGNGGKTLQNRAKTQTQKIARENMTKESMEQTQILETIDKKEENMKQLINPNNTQKNDNIEEKKPVKDVKEQNTNNQQLPEVTITKQNDTNIITTPKEKATTRSQITERRFGAAKLRQLKNNKYEDQKLLEQEGVDKDSCPKCKKNVREGVKCGACDRWIHYKCEEITQLQVEDEYPDKIPYICSMDRKRIEEKTTKQ